MTKQIIDQATPQTMPPYSRDAIFEPDGPLDPRCMEQAICTIIRNTPVDLDEPRSHTSRRTFCAMRALAALHPRDEIEIMLGVQAVCAYHAAADCWRLGANPRRDEDKTRHISKAATAVRTFETALRALERRQAKPLSVPAGRPASRVWDPVDADAVVQALRDRCEIGVDPATRMPTSAEAEHMTDDEIVSTWARHNRFADEHAGLDLANTESILPGGGMIVPEDPTPQQAAYLARRLMLSYVRLQDENRRNGITEKIKVRPHTPGHTMTAPIEEPSPLMAYLLAVLATLMAPALPDVHRARLAAREAIAAHQARGAHEQMTIAQIAAFAVAALDTLRLSMPDDVSLSMKLKLRGNANGLNRSAHDNTQILERGRRTAAPQQANLAEQAAAAGWDIPETPPPPAEPSSRPNLASAMQAVAARLQASTATASPAQRKNNAVWADTLTNVADEIAQGKHKPAHAGTSKAQLLRTTLLAGGPAFPSRAPQ